MEAHASKFLQPLEKKRLLEVSLLLEDEGLAIFYRLKDFMEAIIKPSCLGVATPLFFLAYSVVTLRLAGLASCWK